VIVDIGIYRDGQRVPCASNDLATVKAAADQPDDFVWVGLHSPHASELMHVSSVFGLHPLAVEDALSAHQRPKLEKYDDSLFLVLKTLWYVDETDAVETGEINLFIGSNFVVSVRHGEGSALAEARRDLEARSSVLKHGPSAVVYAVTDRVVDAYESVAACLVEDVYEVEASVFSEERTNDSKRIYLLKRELAEMRRAIHPLREPVFRFATGAVRGLDPEAGPYFRDVADHLSRVSETVDSVDQLLSAAFEAHLAAISIRQNDDMRKISAIVGMIAAPPLIAGVYGMNFDHMPELHWVFGYPVSLLLMALSAACIWIASKRAWWL